jgi:hypothetical protein
MLWSGEKIGSAFHFTRKNYRYKVVTFEFKNTSKNKRVEFYRSAYPYSNSQVDKWVKDSTWIYFSESGDTLRKVAYKNDVEVR